MRILRGVFAAAVVGAAVPTAVHVVFGERLTSYEQGWVFGGAMVATLPVVVLMFGDRSDAKREDDGSSDDQHP